MRRTEAIPSIARKRSLLSPLATDTPAYKLNRPNLALISLLTETNTSQAGQARSDPVDNSKGKIVVTLRAADTPDEKLYKANLTLDSPQSLDETAAGRWARTERQDSCRLPNCPFDYPHSGTARL